MTQTRNLTKAVFIILALVFASSAKAEGRVNFSFSINVNGQNQHVNRGFDPFFNQVFAPHNRNGVQIYFNSNQPPKYKKPHRKTHKFAQLKNKKRFVRHLRKLGYRHVKRIERHGRYYTARAVSPKGHVVWLKVDRYSGYIKGRRVLAWNHRR